MDDITIEISNLSKMVGDIIPGTEEQFLLIGSRLSDVYSDVGKIAGLADSLIGVLGSASMAKTVGSFKDVLTRLEAHIAIFYQRFESGFTSLREVGASISDLAVPLENFRKIVKKLKILGIATKIESAQLKKMESDFTNLAGDVEQLSELICDKSVTIEKHRVSLVDLTNRTLSRVTAINEKSKGFLNCALKDINESIALLEHHNSLSLTTADSLMSRSKTTSSQVGDVVTAMQFHDITRQQIEHICEVLANFTKKTARLTDPADTTEGKDSMIHAEASLVCELQKAQLIDAQEKFVHAIHAIIENLRGILENVFNIIEDVQKITGGSDPSENFLSSIENGTNMVIERFEQGANTEREFLSAMEELSDAVLRISGLVNDIEEIGEEIELIAVNARVKAARTGDEGAPLGVIAEAIWHLSLDATSQKSTISELLKRVISATAGLKLVAAKENEGAGNLDMVRELSDIIYALKEMKDDVAGYTANIESTSRGLSTTVEETINDITVHRDLTRDVTAIARGFDDLIANSRRHVTADELEDARRISYEYIQANYTMQRERTIHDEVASNVIPLASKCREGPAANEFEDARESENDLGDNIELF